MSKEEFLSKLYAKEYYRLLEMDCAKWQFDKLLVMLVDTCKEFDISQNKVVGNYGCPITKDFDFIGCDIREYSDIKYYFIFGCHKGSEVSKRIERKLKQEAIRFVESEEWYYEWLNH